MTLVHSPGDAIDRYRVLSVLGEGGMAVVYEVEHRTLGTRHALKLLTVHHPEVRQRLVREGQVQASLRHPNIVPVTDVIRHIDQPGLLMAYVDGPSLETVLRYVRPSLDEALDIFQAVLAAVDHAHRRGLVHRDLKPGNVLFEVTDRGIVPMVADFGIAKVLDEDGSMTRTRTGATMGTPAYMAPEQIRDASGVDHRADLYSLGCLLYELVVGRPPFDQDDILALFAAVAEGRYTPPTAHVEGLPPNVAATIEALLVADRDQRPQDCAEVMWLLTGERPAGAVPSPDPLPLEGPVGHICRDQVRRREQRRVQTPAPSAPTWVQEDAPAAPPDAPPEERRSRGGTWLAWLVGGTAVVVGGLVLGVVLAVQLDQPWTAPLTDTGPRDRTVLEELTAAEATSDGAAPHATPEATAAPTPASTARPAPRPARPTTSAPPPDAAAVDLLAEDDAGPAPEVTSITIEGDVTDVLLRSPAGLAFRPGDPLDPGRYTVLVRWSPDGERVEAGQVRVHDGQAIALTCRPEARTCVR